MNYLVGLTGGIGSGKSTVADMFAALGVRIVDTDLISHQLTQTGGAAIPAMVPINMANTHRRGCDLNICVLRRVEEGGK